MKHILLGMLLLVILLSSCAPVDPDVALPTFDTGVDPEGWAQIPAGEFYFGQHEVVEATGAYQIMITAVTTAQYAVDFEEVKTVGAVNSATRTADQTQLAHLFAGDDSASSNNRPSTSLSVAAALPPDYAVGYSMPPSWSAQIGTAVAGQIRIQNLSANAGLQPISYSVYRSADRILGGDTLLLSGSRPALGAGDFADLPVADGDTWPAGGQFWYLIATVSSAVDALKKGAAHYLPKPINLDELRATVRQILEKKKLEEQMQIAKDVQLSLLPAQPPERRT